MMDVLQVCYESQMRLYSDRPDIVTPGRWYFCPPGAKVVPFPHAFGSNVWDPDPEKSINPALGEQRPRGPLTDGVAPSRYTGQHWCGGANAWAHGVPYGTPPLPTWSDGIPKCCETGPPTETFCLKTETGEHLVWATGEGCIAWREP